MKANGGNTSNHWFSDSWDVDYLWRDLSLKPPGYFVSFPSLKNPNYDSGPKQRHTAEIVALTTWDAFSPWKNAGHRQRPEDYSALKVELERKLLAQFARRFPALAPMVVYHEASTPLTTLDFIGSPEGAIYGLEVSPRRFLASSLRPRTPVPGLYLAGQDACAIGITGAFLGGFIAAVAAEPKLFAHLPRSLIVI